MLHIDIWSDYACPYCYIGKKQLMQALQELGIDDVSTAHHVFVLEPGKVNHPERTFLEGLGDMTPEKAADVDRTFQNITAMAADVGLTYDMKNMRDVGTIDAHRLTLLAMAHNRHDALENILYDAYLCGGKDISSHAFLLEAGLAAGLAEDDVRAVLNDSKAYMDEVFEDFEDADAREIDLVPHFIFNDRYEIRGVMKIDAIKKVIQEAL